jgi:predicted HAD superfamily Cof-like phosphohydrolase
MSKDWVKDVIKLQEKFGVGERVDEMSNSTLRKFLRFRVDFLQEELDELKYNLNDPEQIVDAMIDLCVVALDTLVAFEVDAAAAWNEVYNANMSKVVGIKESRQNPLGLPDLIKPEGWRAPSHIGNHGLLTYTIKD